MRFLLHTQLMLVVGSLMLAGCSSVQKVGSDTYAAQDANIAPNYSNLYYWAAHPAKIDLSDSTPEPYRNTVPDTSVDVFFVYPTTYTSSSFVNPELLATEEEQRRWNASVDDTLLNTKTDQSTILLQASVFNHYRVFAPRYRQAHFKSFFIADSIARPFFDTAYADVKAAFWYYLKYENKGRPFIIASHSQGTIHAARLIKDTIEGTSLAKNMVAAYLIGMPIRQNYFTSCVPCQSATQTGCFVSWRTFRQGNDPEILEHENFKAIVVNPLTWTMDTLPVSRQLNKGAILFQFNKVLPHAVSASIHNNILWSSKPHFKGSMFYTSKNYHIGDINLFYKNIRDNVDDRVKAFRSR